MNRDNGVWMQRLDIVRVKNFNGYSSEVWELEKPVGLS